MNWPVKRKDCNELGFYDMSGNVWEWCNDWYDEGYYKCSHLDNPRGPDSANHRVARGGAWFNKAAHCRVANRSYYRPEESGSYLGFRLACSP